MVNNIYLSPSFFNRNPPVFLYRIIFLLYFHGMKPPLKLPPASKQFWGTGELSDWSGRQHIAAYLHRNYELGLHSHGFIEVNIVARGRGWHYLGDHVLKTVPNDVFVIPVGMRHGYFSRESLDIFHLLLHPRFMEEYGVKLRSLGGFRSFFTDEPRAGGEDRARHHLRTAPAEFKAVTDTMKRIIGEKRRPSVASDIGVQALSLYLIQLLCRYYRTRHRIGTEKASQSLETVFQFIGRNYSRKLDLKTLAGSANCQRNYLCRLFKRHCGMSPLDYVNNVRLTQAERLILETDKRMKQIAQSTGFYDAAHMNKTFMRFRGHAPGQLRV
jgi:AraC family transcriptional regulator, L-rhamnose operon transcriptional activator RhaR